jgi:adenylylsulfate kinase
MSKNITFENFSVKRQDREKLNNQKSVCLWFTGLSGSGKSTVANKTEELLLKNGNRTYLLDGDNVRHGLNKDLGFSGEDRTENIRRIGELNNLFVDAGIITLNTFISPFRKDRDLIRKLLPENKFVEIYIKTDLETCEKRDPKGLYKKARSGEISNFTGIGSPYEEPLHPELTIVNSDKNDILVNAKIVFQYLVDNLYIINRLNII